MVLDANGNATQIYGAALTYSPDNRLTGVTGIADYGYNGIGERVRKTVGGTTTLYLYGPGGRLMAELDATGQVEKVYVYFAGEPLAVVDYVGNPAGTLYYIHNDHLRTPQALTDEAGVLVWRAVYTPFGWAAVDEDPDLNSIPVSFNPRFPGQYYDAETGFHYNYHRYYDPFTGRYITSDPIGLTGGLNTYAYAGSNPLTFVDPWGLKEAASSQIQRAEQARRRVQQLRNASKAAKIGRALAKAAPAMGTAAASDGPLPIGDVIAILIGAGFVIGELTDEEDCSEKDCWKAKPHELAEKGIKGRGAEHAFKEGVLGTNQNLSHWDICKCKDGSFVLRQAGQCGRSGPTIPADF